MSQSSGRHLVKEMHQTAGEYYRHFSEVRTHSSSLFIPIALLGTIELFKDCGQVSWVVPAAFILFVLAATLFLNVVFSGWSTACRRIERYYETLLARDEVPFEPAQHGFRNLFHALTAFPKLEGIVEGFVYGAPSKAYDELRANHPALPERIDWTDYKSSVNDPFIRGIIGLGAVYMVGYLLMYGRACTAH